jgi:hypothetical protein
MTQRDDGRVERILEGGLGAISDWLEAVRRQENERRRRIAAADRARRDQATVAVMALLVALTIGAFVWVSRAG